MLENDFVICGYTHEPNNINGIILGQYSKNGKLSYKVYVTEGISEKVIEDVKMIPRTAKPAFRIPFKNKDIAFIQPILVCTIQYKEIETKSRELVEPIFICFKYDKLGTQCIED